MAKLTKAEQEAAAKKAAAQAKKTTPATAKVEKAVETVEETPTGAKPYMGLNVYSVSTKCRVDLDPKTATLTKGTRGGYLLQGVSISKGSEGTKAAGAVSLVNAQRLVEDGYFDELPVPTVK